MQRSKLLKVIKALKLLIFLSLLIVSSAQLKADEIRVAVASNFTAAMKSLARQFETRNDHQVILIFGSTGKHYAQIKHGAPFDVFFAADTSRPLRLEQEGIALPASRFTYAVGKLILWSPKTDYVDKAGKILQHGKFRYLAIANPDLAPYGKAAKEVLEAKKLWENLKHRMVRGENIGQTFQFVSSGNAELGLVALSQLKGPRQSFAGSFWDIPQSFYSPIEQQAVLLNDKQAARAFMSFMRSEEALAVIRDFGYGIP